MWAYALLVALPLSAAVLLLVRLVAAPGVPVGVRLHAGLAWAAALGVFLLVPSDLAEALKPPPGTAGAGGSGSTDAVPHAVLAGLWNASYWVCFVAMLVTLPLHQAYQESGEFGVARRALAAARSLSLFYAACALAGAAALGVLLLSHRLTPDAVVGFLVAGSNLLGIVAAVFLLGHGLVEVPRELWRMGHVRGRQRLVLHRLGGAAERVQGARDELSVCQQAVRQAASLYSRRDPLRPCVDRIVEELESWETARADALRGGPGPAPGAAAPGGEGEGEGDDDPLLFEYGDRAELADLRRRVRRAREDYDRFTWTYVREAQRALWIEDVFENKRREGGGPYVSRYGPAPPTRWEGAAWWWFCYGQQVCVRVAALLLGFMSVALALAELTLAPWLPTWFQISLPSWALRSVRHNELATEVVCLLLLAYPCCATYYSLFKLKIGTYYSLVYKHTSAPCMLANALFMCRLAAPLAFNFMCAAAPPNSPPWPSVEDTVFFRLFGAYMLSFDALGPVLGSLSLGFTVIAPALLIPYMLAQAFGLFDRLAVRCGCSRKEMQYEDDWEDAGPALETGKRLLDLEKAALDRGETQTGIGAGLRAAGRVPASPGASSAAGGGGRRKGGGLGGRSDRPPSPRLRTPFLQAVRGPPGSFWGWIRGEDPYMRVEEGAPLRARDVPLDEPAFAASRERLSRAVAGVGGRAAGGGGARGGGSEGAGSAPPRSAGGAAQNSLEEIFRNLK